MSRLRADYDTPWQEVLERYFRECLALFLPQAHADIDWAQAPVFLDKELRQVTPDAELGLRRVDKLAQVWRQDGAEAWVLIHVEVQSQEDAAFAERMYVYNYRLYDRFRRRVASLAVLGDERASWRPERFSYELWGVRSWIALPDGEAVGLPFDKLRAPPGALGGVGGEPESLCGGRDGAPEGVGDASGCDGAQGGEVAVVTAVV